MPRRLDPVVAAAVLLSFPLFLFGLGNTYLWQDEAQTALLARSIAQYGVPVVGEGAASLSAHMGADAGYRGIYFQISWLQGYLAAFSFWLFGESSWSARVPFALAGWLCVPLVAWMMRSIGANQFATRIAAIFAATSVPFIVCSRQSRYYALTAALTLLTLGSYAVLMQRRRERQSAGRASWIFGAAAGLLVASFDVTAIGILGVLAAYWLFSMDEDARLDGAFWLPWCVAVAVLLGWTAISYSAPMRRTSMDIAELPKRVLYAINYYAGQIDAHVMPLPIIVIAIAAGLWSRRAGAAAFLGMAAIGGLAVITISPYRFFRYAVPIVPIVFAITALGLAAIAERGRIAKALVVALVIALVSSSALFAASHNALAALARASGVVTVRDRSIPFRIPLLSLAQELRDPPRGPIAAAVEYLRRHAQDGEVIVTTYGELPLKFHTRLTVFGGETAQLPPPGLRVDWIWPRHVKPYPVIRPSYEWVEQRLRESAYRRIELNRFDRRWENREDPEEHIFTNPGPPGPPVVLYEAAE
jgi:4-amino-4-deoxy-L-arabinose transferase-like glycosyltransferase